MKNNSEQLNKKNSQFFGWLIFLAGGFLAGFLSLGLSVLTDLFLGGFSFWSETGLIVIIYLVAIEEFFKFFLINFFFAQKAQINFGNILNGMTFGFGFGLFELVLISQKSPTCLPILLIFLIHVITSAFMIMAVIQRINKKNSFYFYFLLAFFLHLIYNLIIRIYIF